MYVVYPRLRLEQPYKFIAIEFLIFALGMLITFVISKFIFIKKRGQYSNYIDNHMFVVTLTKNNFSNTLKIDIHINNFWNCIDKTLHVPYRKHRKYIKNFDNITTDEIFHFLYILNEHEILKMINKFDPHSKKIRAEKFNRIFSS